MIGLGSDKNIITVSHHADLTKNVMTSNSFCDNASTNVVAVPVCSREAPARFWILCEVDDV